MTRKNILWCCFAALLCGLTAGVVSTYFEEKTKCCCMHGTKCTCGPNCDCGYLNK